MLRSRLARCVGTVAGVALLLHGVDAGRAAQGLAGADWRWLGGGLALTGLCLVGGAVAWGLLARAGGAAMSWSAIAGLYLQGLFVGQLLPAGTGGDAVRGVAVGRQAGAGPALGSLAGSRLVGTLGMALWGLAGAVILREAVGPMALTGACIFALVLVISAVLALSADSVVRGLGGGRARWRSRLRRTLTPLASTLAGYRRRPHMVMQCALLGVAAWGLNLCALTFFGRAVGVNVGWAVFAVTIPVTLTATLVPFSANGVGVREGILVGLLAHAGVPTAHAAALAILVDLQMLPFALLGAGVYLRGRRRTSARAAVIVLEPVDAPALLATLPVAA